MKILITGGAGFIGQHVINQLLVDNTHSITVYDNLSKQIHGENPDISLFTKPNIKLVKGDVRDIESLASVVLDSDIIIHLASETGTGQSMYDISQYTEVNVNGTANLLHILANNTHHVKKLILSSSRSVYGEGKYHCNEHDEVFPSARNENDLSKGVFEPRCPICSEVVKMGETCEKSNISPLSYYALTKKMQEDLLVYGSENFDFDYVILRYQNVYGPGQSLKNPYTGILSIFSNLMKLNKKEINIFEDGEESRDFVFVEDVARATILSALDDDVKNEIINIGSGIKTTVLNVANTIKKHLDSPIELKITGDYRLGDIRHNVADLSKAKKLLSFEAKTNFEDGIKQFTDWARDQEAGADLYQKSLKEMEEKGLLKSK